VLFEKKTGDRVYLFDATGTTYLAKIESINNDQTNLSIIEKVDKEEKGIDIILGQAMLKLKKMEFIIQKTTELGINTFIPVRTERTILKIKNDVLERKLERWKKISLSAAKQSGRSTLVKIIHPITIQELISNYDSTEKIILSGKAEKCLKDIILSPFFGEHKNPEIPSSTLILIGPEGGWTEKEEGYIVEHGYTRACLGDLILRSETAAISAVSALTLFWK